MLSNEMLTTVYKSVVRGQNVIFDEHKFEDRFLRRLFETINKAEVEKCFEKFGIDEESVKNVFIASFVIGYLVGFPRTDNKTAEIKNEEIEIFSNDEYTLEEVKQIVDNFFVFDKDEEKSVFDEMFVYVLPKDKSKFTFDEVVALFFKFGLLTRILSEKMVKLEVNEE